MTETTDSVSQEPESEVAETANEIAESAMPDVQDDADEMESPNAEAAKWRRQFRDAETQLTEMGQRVEALQRQQIEGLLEASNVKPAALWAVTSLSDLVATDGTVDTEAVSAAVVTARNELGIQPTGKGTHVPGVGQQPASAPKSDAWTDAFAPKTR